MKYYIISLWNLFSGEKYNNYNNNFTFFSDALKNYNVSLKIDPIWVKRGESVLLYCHYNLDGDPLYSVKWYRGQLEFYRYSPSENPPAKIFPFTNLKIDVSLFNL